jgi:hypothetical protein
MACLYTTTTSVGIGFMFYFMIMICYVKELLIIYSFLSLRLSLVSTTVMIDD